MAALEQEEQAEQPEQPQRPEIKEESGQSEDEERPEPQPERPVSALDTPTDNDSSKGKPKDDQSEYIRALEKRLTDFEIKLLQLELQTRDTAGKRHDENEDDSDVPEPQKRTKNSGNNEDSGPEPEPLPIVRETRRLNLGNFVNRFPGQKDRGLIEVRMGPSSMDEEWKKDEAFCRKLRLLNEEEALQRMSDAREKNVIRSDAFMQAVRINSLPLIHVLLEVLNPEQEISNPLLLYRPYAPLIHYFEPLKKKLAEFEAKVENNAKEAGVVEEGEPAQETAPDASDKKKKREADVQILEDFRHFMQFVETEILPLGLQFTGPGKHKKIVHDDDLWYLYQIGEYIYDPAATSMFQTSPVSTVQNRSDQKIWKLYHKQWLDGKFQLKCYCIDHNGESYVCVRHTFIIEPFKNEQDILSLKVYPLRFVENMDDILKECKESGQKFKECLDAKFLLHNGWALPPESDNSLQYISSDVIVDQGEAMKTHLNWKFDWKFPTGKVGGMGTIENSVVYDWRLTDGKFVAYNVHDSDWVDRRTGRELKIELCEKGDPFLAAGRQGKEKEYEIRDEDLLLLPRRMFAYVLQERKFVAVDIRNLSNVKDSGGGDFQNLVIDEQHMGMLQSLVHSHFKRKEFQDTGVYNISQDIVHNKGRGLVILLHGVPGVGKTSTAETIAYQWNRPLLPITYGDLGLSPSQVETKLKDIFRLAQLWGCILLLDEADVFLSERKPSDLERNALVSVFLRVLEYYTGILFLTTNRVGTIDEAFRSRIHISLYYPELTRKQNRKIWELNLDRLEKIEAQRAEATGQPPLNIDVAAIKQFAKDHYKQNLNGRGRWNGRQIRNAFLIASALARYEQENPDSKRQFSSMSPQGKPEYDITARHFETVAKVGLGFDNYLQETKGGKTAGQIALSRGYRNDAFGKSSERLDERHLTSPGQGGPLMDTSPSPHHRYESSGVRYGQPMQYYNDDPRNQGLSVDRGYDRSPQAGYQDPRGRNDFGFPAQQRPVTPNRHLSDPTVRAPGFYQGYGGQARPDSGSDTD
ncbi:hypothetical protein BJY04DRAFT_178805 [Aspergillus karnatakaensis]|uniref:ATP-binding protein n=1 Tax=Aspergillus karnatakaensis TaxID=1810916 RepID=UPI003CCE01DB